MKRSHVPTFLCFVAAFLFFCCQQRATQTSAPAELASIDLLREEMTLCGNGEFGEVTFNSGCDANTNDDFKLAISLLHSFEYEEAEKAFVKVIDADPQCAMAYWGVAMSNFHSLWIQTGTDYLEKGAAVLRAASSLEKSEKEADYLDAIGAFYQDYATVDRKTRIANFERKMEALHRKYDDDREAAIFFALALTATADPADKTYRNQLRSGEILESLFVNQPNHPGIAHYVIHNYDAPELAERALVTARRYAGIAPASAHAQHMPSHIFIRLGLWEEAIQSNISSIDAARCYADTKNPGTHWDEELHGMDYLVYASLQRGDTDKAEGQLQALRSFDKIVPINFKVAYAAAAIPSRIALESRDWQGASALELPDAGIDWKQFPWQRSILHFARALGAARSGNVASAEKEVAILRSDQQELGDAKNSYLAAQIDIELRIAEAWIALAKGNHKKAVALMRDAAESEYATAKLPVTPGEVLPAGELLGDMLMAMKQPAAALEVYERDIKVHPNRFNGLYGAAMAAQATGDKQKATRYFQMLVAMASPDSPRKELQQARSFLGVAL